MFPWLTLSTRVFSLPSTLYLRQEASPQWLKSGHLLTARLTNARLDWCDWFVLYRKLLLYGKYKSLSKYDTTIYPWHNHDIMQDLRLSPAIVDASHQPFPKWPCPFTMRTFHRTKFSTLGQKISLLSLFFFPLFFFPLFLRVTDPSLFDTIKDAYQIDQDQKA